MICTTISKRIVKIALLSLLCFQSVFSVTTETAIGSNDTEDEGEDEDILRPDLYRFTRRKRYATWSWTVPTPAPIDYRISNSPPDLILYGFIPLIAILFVYILFCSCINMMKQGNSSAESTPHPPITRRNNVDISQQQAIPTRILITVNEPPPRTTNLFAEMHTPPTRRHQFPYSRTGDLPMTDLWFKPCRNHTASHNTGANSSCDYPNYDNSSQDITDTCIAPPPDYFTVNNTAAFDNTGATGSFMNHNYASSSRNSTRNCNTVEEKPPDYFSINGLAASGNTGVTGSFEHHNLASSQDNTGYHNTVDNPPDYSTIT